jgi:hypothetical protein
MSLTKQPKIELVSRDNPDCRFVYSTNDNIEWESMHSVQNFVEYLHSQFAGADFDIIVTY